MVTECLMTFHLTFGGRDGKTLPGLKIIGPVEGDPLFVNVELPAGWKKQPTGHSMWSDLVDDKGRKRAGIFYKAASYDRAAHIHWSCRYTVGYNILPEDGEPTECIISINDGGTVIREIGRCGYSGYCKQDEFRDKAKKDLSERFPEYESPFAYWDNS